MQRKWKRRWQRLTKIVLPPLTAGLLFFSVYSTALANPSGGAVTSGAATITASGATTTVQQSTDKAAINWQSFNIAKGETVNFIQPSSASVALNRVIGSDASAIYGSLNANGRVFLINPNGVLFAPGSQVNVGGLVASTLNLSESDFINGKTTFSGSGGSVVNQGNITAQDYAVLIGPQVKNEGVIAAQVTGLAAGKQVSLAFNGDKLLNVNVDTGAVNGSVTNNGHILANGGLVVMSAGTKDALLSTVVNNSGMIKAQSFNNVNGVIRLEGNTVTNASILDASGKGSGQTGGTIKVLGDNVTLTSTAAIDVSGDAGGGTALIGGAYQGKGPVYNATNTTMAAGATISADAITDGNGGQVVLWANDTTKFAGTITAQGGSQSGDGGSVETSGKKTLNICDAASVSTLAANGKTGIWLLDPTNYTIGTEENAANYMKNSYLATQLASTDMNIQTAADGAETGDITITAPVSWSSHSLNLSAANNINIKAALTASGNASLAMNYGGAVDYGLTGSGFAGKINFAGTGTLAMNGHTYTVINSLAALDAADLTQYNQYYALGSDFSLNGLSAPLYTTIDMYGAPYNDSSVNIVLDGLGHALSGLSMSSNSASATGLFGLLGSTGVISNLGLTGVNISAANGNSIGALAASNNGKISNTYVTGTVTGNAMTGVGGLVGYNQAGAAIANSYSAATVNSTASQDVGGLVGGNWSSISGSYSTGNVTLYNNSTNGINYVGGLVGRQIGGAINSSHSTGAVTLTGYNSLGSKGAAGGLVGYNNNGTLSNSYHAAGAVNAAYTAYADAGIAATEHIGGLVGLQEGGSISGSYNTANVSDRYGANIGGLVGYHKAGSITTSYNAGVVSSSTDSYNYNGYIGGLAGYNAGTISNSYNSGSVSQSGGSPSEYRGGAGGLAGHNSSTSGGSIYYCYNSGTVSGFPNRYGGLIYSGAIPASSYFLGSGSATGERTAAQLQTATTYGGWNMTAIGNDNTVWRIYDGYSYPLLRQFLTPLTVTADSASATYSGSTYLAAVTGATYTTTAGTSSSKPGTVFGTLAYGSGSPTDAGTYTLSGLYSASQQGGYDISYSPTSTLTITPKSLTAAATGTSVTKVYDGTTTVSLNSGSYTLVGIVNSDDVNLSVSDGAYNSPNVADANSITITSLGLSGAKAGNYTLTTTAGEFGSSLTGTITARPLTLGGITKVYDGTTGITLTSGNYTLSNIAGSDVVTLSGTGTYNANSVAGANGVSFTIDPVLGGTAAGNYSLTAAASYTGSITARPITVVANAGSKIYGNADPTLNGSLDSGSTLGNGDSLADVTGTLSRENGENVGNYDLVLGSGSKASNYTVTFAADNNAFGITARPITVVADAGSKVYGNADPTLNVSLDNSSTLGNGDSLADVTGTISRENGENVGSYDLVLGSGSKTSNYTVTFAADNNAFGITARPITVVADAGSKVYGNADPTLNVSLDSSSTLGNGDSLADVTGTVSRESGENVGSYDLVLGIGSKTGNYTVTFAADNNAFGITRRPVIVLPHAGQAKIYGDANPTLTYSVGGMGLVNNDTLTGSLSHSGTNVGNYTLGQGTLTNANNANYDIVLSPVPVNFGITRRDLTVSVDNASRYMGQTNPGFTATYNGLAAADTPASLTGSLYFATTADKTSPAGSYVITLTGTLSSPNYTVSYINGLLTVTQNHTPAYNGATGTVSQTSSIFGAGDFNLIGYRGRTSDFNGLAGIVPAPLISILDNGISLDGMNQFPQNQS